MPIIEETCGRFLCRGWLYLFLKSTRVPKSNHFSKYLYWIIQYDQNTWLCRTGPSLEQQIKGNGNGINQNAGQWWIHVIEYEEFNWQYIWVTVVYFYGQLNRCENFIFTLAALFFKTIKSYFCNVSFAPKIVTQTVNCKFNNVLHLFPPGFRETLITTPLMKHLC